MKLKKTYIPSLKLNYDGTRVGRANRNRKEIDFPKQLAIGGTVFEGIADWAVQSATFRDLMTALEVESRSNRDVSRDFQANIDTLRTPKTQLLRQEWDILPHGIDHNLCNGILK